MYRDGREIDDKTEKIIWIGQDWPRCFWP